MDLDPRRGSPDRAVGPQQHPDHRVVHHLKIQGGGALPVEDGRGEHLDRPVAVPRLGRRQEVRGQDRRPQVRIDRRMGARDRRRGARLRVMEVEVPAHAFLGGPVVGHPPLVQEEGPAAQALDGRGVVGDEDQRGAAVHDLADPLV